jgi:hypothetical protein
MDRDARNLLAFDLADILHTMTDDVLASRWTCRGVDALGGPAADELERLSDDEATISGETLLQLAEGITQTINGEFGAYKPDDTQPWLIIRAIDSTAFDVISSDDNVIAAIRRSFSDVADIPV